MNRIQGLLSLTKKVTLMATVVMAMMQCSEEEFIQPASAVTEAQEQVTTASAVTEATEASLTISGINTILAEDVDCSTCTFVVAADLHMVDGEVLKLKPGAVICLDRVKNNKNIEFVNLIGTEESPITIGYCTK